MCSQNEENVFAKAQIIVWINKQINKKAVVPSLCFKNVIYKFNTILYQPLSSRNEIEEILKLAAYNNGDRDPVSGSKGMKHENNTVTSQLDIFLKQNKHLEK